MKVIIGSTGEGVPIVVEHTHPGAIAQREDAERRKRERDAKKLAASAPAAGALVDSNIST